MRFIFLLLLFGARSEARGVASTLSPTEDHPLHIISAIDNNLNVQINLDLKENSSGTSKGFKLYYTNDSTLSEKNYQSWNIMEKPSDTNFTQFIIDATIDGTTNSTVYRIRATVIYGDDTESEPSEVNTISIQDLKSTSPLILDTKILNNTTVMIVFVPGQSMKSVENYTLSYRKMVKDAVWETVQFLSDVYRTYTLTNLEPNVTYKVKMRLVNGGTESNSVNFNTSTAALATIETDPIGEISMDPNDKEKLVVKCTVTSDSVASVLWKVDSERVPKDSSFYTIRNEDDDDKYTSIIEAKTKSRSAIFTCVAKNDAGETSKNVNVTITGPGSPPSEITIKPENSGFNVTWKPPTVKNGIIIRYIVYYTARSHLPVQFWQKKDVDGTETSTHISNFTKDERDGFYVKVQSASKAGPGIISDIVGIVPDTTATAAQVTLHINNNPENTTIVEPREKVSVQCHGFGNPRPTISIAKSLHANPTDVEPGVWIPLKDQVSDDTTQPIVVTTEVSVYTSKYIHCRGNNEIGYSYTTVKLVVEKPGDAPSGIQVLNVNSLDATVVWKNLQFPNLPIEKFTILVSKNLEEDLSSWQPIIHEVQNASFTVDPRYIYQQTFNIQNLDKSTIYYVRIRAENQAGSGPASEPIQFETRDGGPDLPAQNVRMTANEANLVHILWDAPKTMIKITDYVIFYTRDTAEDDFEKWQTVVVPSVEGETFYRKKLDFTILSPKTFYRFRVVPKNTFAMGPASPQLQFETSKQIPIPTDLQIEVAKDNTVDIHFEAARIPTEHFEKYIVSLSTASAGFELLDENKWSRIGAKVNYDEINSMVHIKIDGESLLKNQTYHIRICASKKDHECVMKVSPQAEASTWSPITSFKTSHGKIETLAYWEVENSGKLDFDPDLNEKIELACVGRGNPAPTLTWTWNNMSIGTEWTIHEENINANHNRAVAIRLSRVESGILTCIASNEEGSSNTSVEVHINGPGSAPTFINLTAYRNMIQLSWREPEIPNGEIIRYVIYATKDGDEEDLSSWEKFETSESQIAFQNFGSELEHFIKFQAFSTSGVGIISDVYNVTSDVYYEPLTLEIFDTDEEANFEAAPNESKDLICKGSGKPTPEIFYKFGDEEEMEIGMDDISTSGYRFETSLPARSSKKNLTVECWAKNKYETVKADNVIFVKLPGDAPKGLHWWFEENNDTHILFNWTEPLYPNGKIIKYTVYIASEKMEVSGSPARYGEVPANVNFTIRVSAVNEFGEGEKSMPVFVTTPNRGPKTPPNITKVVVKDGEVHVEWDAPTKPNGVIQYYTIYTIKVNRDGKGWQKTTHPANASSTVFDSTAGFEESIDYELKMTATNEQFESPESEVHIFKIGEPEPVILEFSATYNTSSSEIVIDITEDSSSFDKLLVKIWSLGENGETVKSKKMEMAKQLVIPFSMDEALSYKISLTGLRSNQGITTTEVDLVQSSTNNTPTTSPPSSATTKDKRYQIKEPPL